MAQHDDKMDRLERILKEAHRNRSEPALGPAWLRSVMRDVRRASTGAGRGNGGLLLEQQVWRAAAAAAAVAVVFCSLMVLTWTGQGDGPETLEEELEIAAVWSESE